MNGRLGRAKALVAGELTPALKIVGAAHTRLVALTEKLRIPAERDGFGKCRSTLHYAACGPSWTSIMVSRLPDGESEKPFSKVLRPSSHITLHCTNLE
jgi:hypothetical protein